MTLIDTCDRFGCSLQAETFCARCQRPLCSRHNRPGHGHVCVLAETFNAQRVLDPDEIPAALERFRPLA